jgi:hypothetical protein
MEAPAPYHTAPKPPRNLTAPIAAWLRTQGFEATEQAGDEQATLTAIWTGPRGERFGVSYLWSPRYDGTVLSLQVAYPGQTQTEMLIAAQQVRRLRDLHLLLLGNLRYANARLLVPA